MNREKIFMVQDGSPSTFETDESLGKLPLPKLEDSLERYYKNLLPFGSDEELKNSRKVLEEFKNGEGKKLQKMLEEKASKERNWVEKFWEQYAYHELRLPLSPYCLMVQPFLLPAVGIEESPEYKLKAMARIAYHTGEFWNLMRTEKLKPTSSPDGKIILSSDQYRRVYNTSRIPGEFIDEVKCYFKTISEGQCPSHVVVIGCGRIFYFDIMHNGKLLSPVELLHAFTIARDKIENESFEPGIPALTCDDRTNWFKNRQHLVELSPNNPKLLEIVESSVASFSFDDNEPRDISEVSQKTLNGNVHSRWLDKSSGLVAFKNGTFGFVAEHSCFDGMLASSPFLLVSLMECQEPDWNEELKVKIIPKEAKFEIDDHLRNEIVRVEKIMKEVENSVIVKFEQFEGFGKNAMKDTKVHPDCFVQMALQLAYFKLHEKLAPTYETGTTRLFYHGRTETVRSCSIEVKEWLDRMYDGKSSKNEIAKLFREAANSQFKLMSDAKNGKGFDRHLFGLWCMAYENKLPIPAFYDDPLYAKSGGGGNFVLSTSTLGYFINIGLVAPMIIDGYGVFYTMLEEKIWIVITTYRESQITSGAKFYGAFSSSMSEIKEMLESSSGKL